MDFGFNIPPRGPLASRDNIIALSRLGEKLGFSYIAIPDHIIIPRTIASPYPYNVERKMVGASDGDCMEQLVLMSFLAAATQKIRLLTSVMVVPHRNPVFTAKALATIDVLSQGRVTVGCGAGWMDEEFRAIGGIPPFAERGKVTNEYLRIFKALWTEDNPEFSGDYAQFADVSFLPKPVQKPHPPLWIGGESPAALRRAAALGDAWYPIGSNPQFPLNTIERYQEALGRLRGEAEKIKRDPATIDLAYWANWYVEGQTLNVDTGQRQLFTGNDEQVAQDIRDLRACGVNHLLFNFVRSTLEESLTAVERFAATVLPLAAE